MVNDLNYEHPGLYEVSIPRLELIFQGLLLTFCQGKQPFSAFAYRLLQLVEIHSDSIQPLFQWQGEGS